eukprot:7078807-Prymnesium_polylepis.1
MALCFRPTRYREWCANARVVNWSSKVCGVGRGRGEAGEALFWGEGGRGDYGGEIGRGGRPYRTEES